MTALSTEWAPGYITPGARPFENMPSDLELTGVRYEQEQIDLMCEAARFRPTGWHSKMHVLTIAALPDPVWPEAEALGLPCLTIDDEQRCEPVLIPMVAEVDCSEWEGFDKAEPLWRRFPALLARGHVYSKHTGILIDGLTPMRLWNCWPLEEFDAPMVQAAVAGWFETVWNPYLLWLAVRDNADESVCTAWEAISHLPDDKHHHEIDPSGYLVACRDGESWFDAFQSEHLRTDYDGDPYPVPFAPVTGLHHLTEVWQSLLASSRSNTTAALASYPDWDREDIARTERHYSPWLWSS